MRLRSRNHIITTNVETQILDCISKTVYVNIRINVWAKIRGLIYIRAERQVFDQIFLDVQQKVTNND